MNRKDVRVGEYYRYADVYITIDIRAKNVGKSTVSGKVIEVVTVGCKKKGVFEGC